MNVYQMCVNNLAAHIRSQENLRLQAQKNPEGLDAFEAARVLSIAFCKLPHDVVADLMHAGTPGLPEMR